MTKTNTGNINTGNWNTGNWNTGNCNTGDWNIGNCNTGYWNTGDSNTGYWNTGDWNIGNNNTGYWNTGDWNTGNCNTGDWNTGDSNTGYCNTVTPDDVLIFNKPAKRSDWEEACKPAWMCCDLTLWISEAEMSDKEKDAYPSYVTTGGYLKAFSTLHDAFKASWDKADREDRAKTFNLPNFDLDVFKEIFGFDPTEGQTKTIVIDGKEIEISEDSYNAFKAQFND